MDTSNINRIVREYNENKTKDANKEKNQESSKMSLVQQNSKDNAINYFSENVDNYKEFLHNINKKVEIVQNSNQEELDTVTMSDNVWKSKNNRVKACKEIIKRVKKELDYLTKNTSKNIDLSTIKRRLVDTESFIKNLDTNLLEQYDKTLQESGRYFDPTQWKTTKPTDTEIPHHKDEKVSERENALEKKEIETSLQYTESLSDQQLSNIIKSLPEEGINKLLSVRNHAITYKSNAKYKSSRETEKIWNSILNDCNDLLLYCDNFAESKSIGLSKALLRKKIAKERNVRSNQVKASDTKAIEAFKKIKRNKQEEINSQYVDDFLTAIEEHAQDYLQRSSRTKDN